MPEMRGSLPRDQKEKRLTMQKAEAGQTGNLDIVSITVGSTVRARRKNGNSKSGSSSSKKSGEKEEKKTCKQPAHDSPPQGEREQGRTRSHRGGRTDQGATGDKTKTKDEEKKKIDRDTERDIFYRRTGGQEKLERKKSDRERSDRSEGKRPKRTQTQAGGHGRRSVDGDNARDSSVERRDSRSANTGSGSATSQELNKTAGEMNAIEPQLRSDTGIGSRAMLVDIISKLFPLAIEVDSSTCSTAPYGSHAAPGAESHAPSSLDDTIVALEALENNFEDLAKWFESFESTKARNVIGFDLAMELWGCYDLIIRRLRKGLRDTFGKCSFIQSAQQVEHADQVLKFLEGILKGDANHELKATLQGLSCLPEDTNEPGFDNLQKAVQTLSQDTAHLASARHIEESLEVQWHVVIEIGRALLQMVQHRGDQLLSTRAERTRQQNDCMSARQEIAQLQRERNEARADSKRNQCTVEQLQTTSDLLLEDIKTKDREALDRINELQKLNNQSQVTQEELKSEMCRIALVHHERKVEWNAERDELRKQLDAKDDTIHKIQSGHLKELGELDQQIRTLTERNENLTSKASTLESNMQASKVRHTRELDSERLEKVSINDSLSTQRGLVQGLMCNIAASEDKRKELNRQLETSTEEMNTLNARIEELLMSKNTLCSLEQFFGFKLDKFHPETVLNRIRGQTDASFERIEKVLKRTCIRVTNAEDDSHDQGDQDEMDTVFETGTMFKAYESQIRNIIESLRSEHIPMELSGDTRIRKTPVKRKSLYKIDYANNIQSRCKKQGAKETVKREADHGVTFKSQAMQDVKPLEHYQVIPQPDSWFSSVCDRVHSHVHTFDIELGDNCELVRTPIPAYIAKDLIASGRDVKIINLGHVNPVDTLLSVIQAEYSEIEACPEISQSTCHCSQMKLVSERLRCTLFISWTPGGEHEIYGYEHKDKCLYTIVVYKPGSLRLYYLLSVNIDTSYTYNLAKLPFIAQFHPDKPEFVHKTDSTCRGPGFPNPNTHAVDTIATTQLILHDT